MFEMNKLKTSQRELYLLISLKSLFVFWNYNTAHGRELLSALEFRENLIDKLYSCPQYR